MREKYLLRAVQLIGEAHQATYKAPVAPEAQTQTAQSDIAQQRCKYPLRDNNADGSRSRVPIHRFGGRMVWRRTGGAASLLTKCICFGFVTSV